MRANLPGFFLHGTVSASRSISQFKYLNTNFISENILQTNLTWKVKEDCLIQIIPVGLGLRTWPSFHVR